MNRQEELIERAKCSVDPFYFAKYGRIKEPGVGPLPFQSPEHVLEIMRLVYNNKYSALLKARQIYASWTVALITLHDALFKPASLTLMTSEGEKKAAKLLDKVKYLFDHLPPFLQTEKGAWGAERITFPKMESEVSALPSTEAASIGEHASLVVMDEADFHEYATEYFNNGKPTIDKGDSKLVMLSAINAKDQATLFKSVCRTARAGRGQFAFLFIPYHVLPERDDAWLDMVCDNEYSESGMTKELYKATQYPSTAEEALAPPSAIAAFDHKVLALLLEDSRDIKPIERLSTSVINVYKEYVVGHTYTGFTDTSEGTGNDDGVSVVLDVNTGKVVADIKTNFLSEEELAYHSYKMLEMYRFPLWGIENNKQGIIVCNKALEMNYPDLFYQDWQNEYIRNDQKKSKVGWNSGSVEGSTKHRTVLWIEGINAVNKGEVIPLSKEGITDFFGVVRNPAKQGRIMGLSGTHDDYPFAVCGAWQMTKFINTRRLEPIPAINIL